MRRALAEERGLAGIVLVIVIAWALAAVLMLIGTLTNARQIDDRVKIINSQVTPIDRDLDNVKLLNQTERIAEGIRRAATPLTGQLDQVISAAASINKSAGSILRTARTINGTAKTINGTVTSIHGTVLDIGRNVSSIHASIGSVFGHVRSINSLVHSINANARSINGSVRSIHGRAGGILATARAIDNADSTGGVAGINRRAADGIGVVGAIKGDFDDILSQVGTNFGSPGNATIRGHANSIDCAAVLNTIGHTTACGQQ